VSQIEFGLRRRGLTRVGNAAEHIVRHERRRSRKRQFRRIAWVGWQRQSRDESSPQNAGFDPRHKASPSHFFSPPILADPRAPRVSLEKIRDSLGPTLSPITEQI